VQTRLPEIEVLNQMLSDTSKQLADTQYQLKQAVSTAEFAATAAADTKQGLEQQLEVCVCVNCAPVSTWP
jgi:ABC-type transporter Mla subunit MlaD